MRISDWSSDVCSSDLIAPIDAAADRDIAVEQIGLGKAQFDRFRIARIIDRRLELLAEAAEVALADRGLEQEILDRRETGRQRQFAGRLFLDIGFEDDAVGRAAFLALALQIFLEIAKAVDAALGAIDAEAVEPRSETRRVGKD